MPSRTFRALTLLLCLTFICGVSQAASYKYIRIGAKTDLETKAVPGAALMGGGKDLDEAFRWMCEKANGGDFLILRARGDDAYNPYVNGLCKLNSVATLIIKDRKGAQKPKVADIIRHAEAIFIAGGDQSRYEDFWRGTPVADAINADIAEGKPIGGTSAGLAVLGEFSYGAQGDKGFEHDLSSAEVLQNPYSKRVTLDRDFLKVPHLGDTITDSHFAIRDRMGRTLGFLARIMQDGWSKAPRDIAIDEKSSVLVESDGKAKIVGFGRGAYFIRPAHAPEVCEPNQPLTFTGIAVYHAPTGAHFDLDSWSGEGGNSYTLSVEKGAIHSTQENGSWF